MKLLFDENLSFKLCARLKDQFPGSSRVRLLGLERADDLAVWRHARANDFALVTLDADFFDLSTLLGSPPKVIWLRCGNQPTAAIEALLRVHRSAIDDFARGDAGCLEIY